MLKAEFFDFCKVCRGFCGLGAFREGFIPMQRYFLRGDDLPQRENGGDRFTMVARGHYGPSLQISRLLCLGEGIYNIQGFIHLSVITIRGRGKIGEFT